MYQLLENINNIEDKENFLDRFNSSVLALGDFFCSVTDFDTFHALSKKEELFKLVFPGVYHTCSRGSYYTICEGRSERFL